MASITYTISDQKFQDFKDGFLKRNPVPLDRKKQPIMTENAWIKECGKQFFLQCYLDGKTLIAQEQSSGDPNIVN